MPVLVDFGEVVTDSWAIAKYLDDNDYQERLLLLGGGTKFVNQWADTQLHPALIRVVLKDTYDMLIRLIANFFGRRASSALANR